MNLSKPPPPTKTSLPSIVVAREDFVEIVAGRAVGGAVLDPVVALVAEDALVGLAAVDEVVARAAEDFRAMSVPRTMKSLPSPPMIRLRPGPAWMTSLPSPPLMLSSPPHVGDDVVAVAAEDVSLP